MGILLCGLNGAGKSTIGRILAECMCWQFIDNEDLYFPKEDASYLFSNPRSKEEVIHLLEEKIEEDNRFVFAAVKGDYGEKLLAKLDYIVLIEVPKETRMERVKMRSAQKFGDRIQEHGDLADKENAWFSVVNSRPENFVTEWLERVPCPVIRIDGTAPVEENVDYLLGKLLTYDIQVRQFKKEDAQEVRNLVVRNFLEVNSKDYGLAAMEKLAETYDVGKILNLASYAHTYVFEWNGKIVGTGSISSFWGSLTESILLTIFVIPEFHGKGIGTKIINTLEQDEFYVRASRVEIPASITAVEFYRKFGYDYKNGKKELDEEHHYRLEKFVKAEKI